MLQAKSIIGSSAGGIFALAVSTNISPNDLLNICYTMNTIPSTDRITVGNLEQDKYGNQRDKRV